MRERVTITINKDVLKKVDKLVDGLTIRSRSQAMEYLLTKMVKGYQIDGALILAGGYDKIGNLPKCMASVRGKPTIEHIINSLKFFGIKKFVIYVDFLGEKIRDHLKDGKNLGVEINYIIGGKPKGRAAPIKLAKDYFDKTFLVYYGDTLSTIDLNDMIRTHKDGKALATIALTTVSNPGKYGVVKMKGNRITEFEEKPEKFGSHLVSAGIFLVEPEVLRFVSSKMSSLENDLFPKLAKKKMLQGYPFEGAYININDKDTLRKANLVWK